MARLGTYNPQTGEYEKVSNYDVAAAIGSGSLDVGRLFCSELINKNSMRKPLPLMKDKDTPIELTADQFKEFQEGVYIKPYGLSPFSAEINEYVFNGGTSLDLSLDEEDMKPVTEWVYSKPKMNETETLILNGENQEIFARLSDFCGYDHYANPPVKVEWKDSITDEDGVVIGGVYATVTLAKRESHEDGGVIISDFMSPNASTGKFSVSMLCITKDAYSIPNDNHNTQRYAFGADIMSVAMAEGETQTIGVHNGMLASISGTFTFIIVVSSQAPTYEKSSDGWTDFVKLHYFPRVSNAQIACLVAEYAVKQKAVNDIKGTTIYLTKYDGQKNTRGELYNAIGVDNLENLATDTTNYIYFVNKLISDDQYAGYGCSIKVKDQISSNIRKIAFRGEAANANVTDMRNYLNYSQEASVFYGGLKPLLSRIPMTDGSSSPYLADFFLQFNSTADVKLIMRVSSSNNVTQEILGTFNCSSNSIKYITFENVIDVHGKITGSKLIVGYGYFSNDISDSEEMELTPIYEGCYPFLPSFGTSVDGNETVISDYGDIHISLPSDLAASQHRLGGYLRVDFGYYGDTPIGELFVRGDKLNQ